MTDLTRRSLIIGGSAAFTLAAIPARATSGVMPPARLVRANGIELSVHDVGAGPAVILLHGFPSLAFGWRHQIAPLVAAGYRVIVPDLRGYGRSDAPEAVEAYSVDRLTGDVVGIMDALNVKRAAIVGHDWGGLLAWQMPLLHPTRVAAVVSVNTPYIPDWMLWLHPDVVQAALPEGRTFVADPDLAPIEQMRQVYSPDMYVLMFQDGLKADRAMARSPRETIRATYRKGVLPASQWDKLPRSAANMEVYGKPLPAVLPGDDVLSRSEVDFYVRAFERTRFTPAINWYRNLDRNWSMTRTLDPRIDVPSLMVSGRDDFVLRPSMTDGMDAYVSKLARHTVENCGHWTPEEKPAELNRIMLGWLATVERSRFA